MKIIQGKKLLPPRIVLYGTEGIGKSSFCAMSKLKTLYIDIEDGLSLIDCDRLERVTDLEMYDQQISMLCAEKHDYKLICIDSLDWLVTLIERKICQDSSKMSVAQLGYGLGFDLVSSALKLRLRKLDEIRSKGVGIVLLAHAQTKRFENPITEAYDRYVLKLREKEIGAAKEWCDALLFVTYKVAIRESDSTKKIKGVGAGDRVVYTEERPAYDAKNRYALPHTIDFNCDNLFSLIRQSVKVEKE
jgi:hypothetical protein